MINKTKQNDIRQLTITTELQAFDFNLPQPNILELIHNAFYPKKNQIKLKIGW